MRIDVLGAVRAWDDDGRPIGLGGPRHREVLARLVAAEGRMVTADALVDDLWPQPPARALGALRTFVAALRRAIEPDRPPRTPPRVLVTEGTGYALRLPRPAVDVHRFEDALATARRSPEGVTALGEVLSPWRGPAYADLRRGMGPAGEDPARRAAASGRGTARRHPPRRRPGLRPRRRTGRTRRRSPVARTRLGAARPRPLPRRAAGRRPGHAAPGPHDARGATGARPRHRSATPRHRHPQPVHDPRSGASRLAGRRRPAGPPYDRGPRAARSPSRAATPSSSPGATASRPSRRPNVPGTSR